MMYKQQLSIIIPVYQAEAYLNACIDSVIKQTFTDFELILVNDGSSDRSGDICDERARSDARIKVIHKPNGGQSTARNRGIEVSTGKYIGFIDNDDIVDPTLFATLVKNIEKNSADISACSFQQVDEAGNKYPRTHSEREFLFDNEKGMTAFLSAEVLDHFVWTKIYKKSLLEAENIRFEEGKSEEDFLFNFEAFSFAQKSVFIDNPLYTYHHRETSTSRLFAKHHLNKYLEGVLYRVNKIENITSDRYPNLAPLARRQKMFYAIQMISKMVKVEKSAVEQFYNEVMRFFKKYPGETFRNKAYIQLSYLGILLLIYLPSGIYFYYKKIKERL
ncbi:MAG TPA: glycosyltransferase [Parapedobacter sp.]|uniref:glycosyltransferase n=1 Tax=Parapedobacter sp. TaxID=1958893 RepID=UPI002B7ECDB1|nr:glycosyltransferase [Parapedobacter sp.]HWK56127.1 glycosyltransferase [Parapedobacter sp.]